MDLSIEKLVYGGEGLARDQGKVVLVPFVLPGEQVIADPVTRKKDLVRASVTEVRQPSPHRTPARCAYFEACGGCSYQHARYGFEVEQKIEILREVLRRVGKIEAPAEIGAVTGSDWEYRNRVQLHFDGRRLGYHQAGSHNVVSVEQCPIASPTLNQAISRLQTLSKSRRWPEFLRTFELFTNGEQTLFNVTDSGARRLSRSFFEWVNGEVPGALDSALTYEGFRVSHRSFFQVNRFLIQRLVEAALSDVQGETCLDLYAGVGLFSRVLAERFAAVIAVEAVQSAVADLEVNVPGAKAVRQPVEEFLESVDSTPDYVIADPPRAGLTSKVTQQLLRIKPRRLTIVSCDPPTLARDLAALLPAYSLQSLTLIDLFPRTAAIESIAQLQYAG